MRKVTSRFVLPMLCIVFGFASFASLPHRAMANTFTIDENGGDCGNDYGLTSWNDETKTCTLIRPIVQPHEYHIVSNGIIFDGGLLPATGLVIAVDGHSHVEIRNVFMLNGGVIRADSSSDINIHDVRINGGTVFLDFQDVPNLTLKNVYIINTEGRNLYARGNMSGLTMRNVSFVGNISLAPLSPTDQIYGFDIDQSNTINRQHIYYFENETNQVFDALPNAGAFYCVGCHGVSLTNTVFQSTDAQSQVNLYASPNSTVSGNTVQNTSQYGVYAYRSPDSLFENNEIINSGVGMEVYFSPDATIKGNLFSNNGGEYGVGLEVAGASEGAVVTGNNFEGNNRGLAISSHDVTVVQNNFISNSRDIENVVPETVFAEPLPVGGNYYGRHDSEDEGCVDSNKDLICDLPYIVTELGTSMTDTLPWNVQDGWLHQVEQFLPSNILFIPGIEASRLFGADGTRLWEPSGDGLLSRLSLNPDGTSVEQGISANGIIDNAYIPIKGNMYKSFIEDLNTLVTNGTIAAWQAASYDWRLSPTEVVENASSTLITILSQLKESSRSGKVTIVAHSNGGLIAKHLVEVLNELGNTGAGQYVDRIIFVAVPHLGTPKAIGALLHGFGQSISSVFIGGNKMSAQAARTLMHNMPGAYNLLPSDAYFKETNSEDELPKSVASFDDSPMVAELRGRYGETIDSGESLEEFITDDRRRASSTPENLNYPSVGSELLIAKSEGFHLTMDEWAAPNDIETFSVAGWGKDTISGLEYYTGKRAIVCTSVQDPRSCITEPVLMYRPRLNTDGDGTVMVPSVLTEALAGVEEAKGSYWFDIAEYNHDNLLPQLGGLLAKSHANIFEAGPIREFVEQVVTATTSDELVLPDYIYDSSPSEKVESSPRRFSFFLHSPLNMHIVDEAGNTEENIPDAEYETFGEVQYISVPTDRSYSLVMNAFASGSFTLDVFETEGDTVIASSTFSSLVSTSSVVTLVVTENIFDGVAQTGFLPLQISGYVYPVMEESVDKEKEEQEEKIEEIPEVPGTPTGGNTGGGGGSGNASNLSIANVLSQNNNDISSGIFAENSTSLTVENLGIKPANEEFEFIAQKKFFVQPIVPRGVLLIFVGLFAILLSGSLHSIFKSEP